MRASCRRGHVPSRCIRPAGSGTAGRGAHQTLQTQSAVPAMVSAAKGIMAITYG
jgi:hypothetical protein